MRIMLITGNHLRHRFIVSTLCQYCEVVGWIAEVRDPMVPTPPAGLSEHLTQLFNHHFAMRDRAENEFFADGADIPARVPQLSVSLAELNGARVHDFLRQHPADVVISYGCHKLLPETMNILPHARFVNIHGGLSPYYRGVTTHFWPVYFLEPQMVGFTLHETTQNLDGGAILLQNSYQPVRGDTLHFIAARTTVAFAQLLAERLSQVQETQLPPGIKQRTTGRLFVSADWRPEHLRLIYDFYHDAIVDALLDGEIQGRTVPLIDVWAPRQAQ